jgi:hypothetical protein
MMAIPQMKIYPHQLPSLTLDPFFAGTHPTHWLLLVTTRAIASLVAAVPSWELS